MISVDTEDGPAEPTVWGDLSCRQLRHLARGAQVRRAVGAAERHRRRLALRDRRLPRPQRGDARPAQRQAQDRPAGRAPRSRSWRNGLRPARHAGSARPDARRSTRPNPRQAAPNALHVQHAQDASAHEQVGATFDHRFSDSTRCQATVYGGAALGRSSSSPFRSATQGADALRRRGRPRPQLRRRRGALFHDAGRPALMRIASAPSTSAMDERRARLHQQERRRRARCKRDEDDTRVEHRPVRAGRVEVRRALGCCTAGCAEPTCASAPRTTSSRRATATTAATESYRATTPVAGMLFQARPDDFAVRQLRPRLRDADLRRAGEREPAGHRAQLRPGGEPQPPPRGRREDRSCRPALRLNAARVRHRHRERDRRRPVLGRPLDVQERRPHRPQRPRARRRDGRHRAVGGARRLHLPEARCSARASTPSDRRARGAGHGARRQPASRRAEERALRRAALPEGDASTRSSRGSTRRAWRSTTRTPSSPTPTPRSTWSPAWCSGARAGGSPSTCAWITSTDQNYAGSVVVNDANSRYFEPSPQRNMTVGVQAKLQF